MVGTRIFRMYTFILASLQHRSGIASGIDLWVPPSHDQKTRAFSNALLKAHSKICLIRPEHRWAVCWKPPLLFLLFVCFLRSRFAACRTLMVTEDELSVVFVIIQNFSEPCHVRKCRSSEKACLFVWLVSFSSTLWKNPPFLCISKWFTYYNI